jgi:5-(carboxyamino)imidazole ribonucleotide mutase
MPQQGPLVGVVMGSDSDWPTMQAAAVMLKEFGVPFEARVVSAHRTPDLLFEYASTAATRGLKAIIAGAGGAAHLPGMLAAKSTLPVLGVPVQSKALSGQDSLLSIVQMPKGIPVATFAIGEAGAANAALFAVALLATGDRHWPNASTTSGRRRREGDGHEAAGSVTSYSSDDHRLSVNDRPAFRASRSTLPCTSDDSSPCNSRHARWRPARPLLRRRGARTRLQGLGSRPRPAQSGRSDRRPPSGCRLRRLPALDELAQACTAISTEFENVPAGTLDYLAKFVLVRPSAAAVSVCQNRIAEKNFLRDTACRCRLHCRAP